MHDVAGSVQVRGVEGHGHALEHMLQTFGCAVHGAKSEGDRGPAL